MRISDWSSDVCSSDLAIRHFNDMHSLAFGELDGSSSSRVRAIENAFSTARFNSHASENILQEMWEKWVFIASAAGLTCLMRATIAEIIPAGAKELATSILEDCAALAKANGFAVQHDTMEKFRAARTKPDSPPTPPMPNDKQHKERTKKNK